MGHEIDRWGRWMVMTIDDFFPSLAYILLAFVCCLIAGRAFIDAVFFFIIRTWSGCCFTGLDCLLSFRVLLVVLRSIVEYEIPIALIFMNQFDNSHIIYVLHSVMNHFSSCVSKSCLGSSG